MTGPEEPLAVPLPDRIGRRPRLGPFPSGPDAVKFASYAAVGAVVAGATTPVAWIPFLLGGFAVAVARPGGKGVDARLADYVRFRYRARRRPGAGRRPVPVRGAIARTRDGRTIAVVRTGGVPVAFLPRAEARGLFESYKALLRAEPGGFWMVASSAPIPRREILPTGAPPPSAPERAARTGYAEMLGVLVRRRRRRVVDVVLAADEGSGGSLRRLEDRIEALFGRLLALGLEPRRLRDAELARALATLGGGAAP